MGHPVLEHEASLQNKANHIQMASCLPHLCSKLSRMNQDAFCRCFENFAFKALIKILEEGAFKHDIAQR